MTNSNIKNNKTKKSRNYKKELSVIAGIAVAATVLAVLFGHGATAATSTQYTNMHPNMPGIAYAPFNFGLPDGVIDGKHYTQIRMGGMPEASIAKGTTISLPIAIIPTTTKPTTIQFSTTFGDQLGLPKMPPGVLVTIQPNAIVLQPGHDSIINMVVEVDKNAQDGTYMQNIVGKWGGPNDFLGSAVSLKIGAGTPQFLFPRDVGQ